VHAIRKRPLVGGKEIFFGDAGSDAAFESRAGKRQARQVGETEGALRRTADDDAAIAQN
jgi:hypothetical protein